MVLTVIVTCVITRQIPRRILSAGMAIVAPSKVGKRVLKSLVILKRIGVLNIDGSDL